MNIADEVGKSCSPPRHKGHQDQKGFKNDIFFVLLRVFAVIFGLLILSVSSMVHP
jgi:hypothetical protein